MHGYAHLPDFEGQQLKTPVRPDLVAEFVADTAIDEGRYRHPVRFLRLRTDLSADDVPLFPTGP